VELRLALRPSTRHTIQVEAGALLEDLARREVVPREAPPAAAAARK
jgi:hypothetical protein